MKATLRFLTVSAAVLIMSSATWARDVAVPLAQVFIPAVGYDNNDTVQLVLTGSLPNSCYQLREAVVGRDGDGNPTTITQMAQLMEDGICAQDAELPVHLQQVVPFSAEVNIGRVAAGVHTIHFMNEGSTLRSADYSGSRTFTVAQAVVPTVDNMHYAAMAAVSVLPLEREESPVMATLTGILTSGCVELTSVNVHREGDVVIVLPGVTVREDVICTRVLRPFSRTVNLGAFASGNYLVHVRSAGGRAVNSVFTVLAN